MTHPYPPHLAGFDYLGRYHYSLTFVAQNRRLVFTEAASVEQVLAQILRAGREKQFEITAYCFMPDHLHMLVKGLADASDCRAFVKAAKQYSGYYFAKAGEGRLWQRYGFERVARDEFERAMTIKYILENPLREGLASKPSDYPFLGSERYTTEELIEQAGGILEAIDVYPEP